MTSNVIRFTRHKLTRHAGHFVKLYAEEGTHKALEFAVSLGLSEDEMVDLGSLVHSEFTNKGYTFGGMSVFEICDDVEENDKGVGL